MSKPMILFAIVILIQIKVRFCEWMNDKTNDSSISVIGYSKKSSHLKCLLHFFKNDFTSKLNILPINLQSYYDYTFKYSTRE